MKNERLVFYFKIFITALASIITTVIIISEVCRKNWYTNKIVLLLVSIPLLGLCAYVAYNILNLII